MNWIWQTILIFIVGTIFLRLSGRKSIAQMTMPETVIMISFGTLIIQPVTGHGIWRTFVIAALLAAALVLTEYLQLKFDKMETLISGKSVAVIQNGKIIEQNMKKLRLTVDKLETRLRQNGITSIKDIQTATIEVSGQLGYTLKPEKQPATKEDLQKLMQLIEQNNAAANLMKTQEDSNIFTEVINEASSPSSPKHLQ